MSECAPSEPETLIVNESGIVNGEQTKPRLFPENTKDLVVISMLSE
jgi:hypothetical protein